LAEERMTTTRILPTAILIALATAGAASGQIKMPPYAMPGRSAADLPPPTTQPGANLDRLAAPVTASGDADPVGTLTQPTVPGSYASPWYAESPGCGSFGGHGPVAYDVYWRTGPSFAFGSGEFTDRLHMGWQVAGGAKTLFFNQEGDAAWTFDLGLSYTYNRGSNDDFVNLAMRQPDAQGFNNQAIIRNDVFDTARIRGLHRTSFNFGLGRDWFLWGVGVPGSEDGWNFRFGADVGGRWGTAHVDLVPVFEDNGYNRRQKVFHGTYIGFHSNFEKPMGGWVLFGGTRVEYGYDWMDIVPPIKGDVQSVNLLFTGGVRY
jgi:hypothetical protein